MSKGIRTLAKQLFIELAPKRLAGEYGPIDHYLGAGNTEFRRDVMTRVEAALSVKVSSSATAYNYAKVFCEKNHPELVVGLGRPADKKGGRKPAAVAASATDAAQASDAAAGATSAATTTVADTVKQEGEPVAA